MLLIWLKGVLMGLAIAAPVGPIALLCIRRTLSQGRWIGLLTGLGAATADGLYGVVAAFGLSTLSELLVQNTHYLQFFGGLFLCYLGLTAFFAKPAASSEALSLDTTTHLTTEQKGAEQTQTGQKGAGQTQTGQMQTGQKGTGQTRNAAVTDSASKWIPNLALRELAGAYGSTLALTLTNPATILSFIAIFAGLGITQANHLHSVTLVFGVFTGSAMWWLMLVSGVIYLRNRLTPERLARFNRWSTKVFGVLLIGFGVAALIA
ncbi:MAG: LysE family transporter [Cyanobacteria bacterium P01_D01_bin.105]